MKVLVTGGSGFIGSHLVEKLRAAGHKVDILDVRKPVDSSLITKWINKDIRENLDDVISGYDAVYHLAAVANARACGQFPRKAYGTNLQGTFNVASACLKNDIPRVLYASSTWMAGLQVGDVVSELDPFEVHKMNTIYGATKLSSEMVFYAMLAEKKAPNFTIMRYGIPYGERMWDGLVVRAFMQQAEKYKVISIMGDGLQGRNFLYVGDMCDAQVRLLDKKADNKVYNLGSPEFVTIREIAEEVVKHYPAKISYITQARVEPKLKNVTSEEVLDDFGWKPETSFQDGIKKCVDWWKKVPADMKDEVPYFMI